MADAAARGAAALTSSDFSLAVSEYTKALIEIPTSPDFYVQRSIAFTRVKPAQHELALKDADFAVVCAHKRGSREKIQAAQQRRVVSLYNVGQYSNAKFVLSTMLGWRPKDNKAAKMEGDMWSAKIESKLNTLSEPQQVTAKEYPNIKIPTEAELKAQLTRQLKADGSYNYPEDISSVTTQSQLSSTAPDTMAQGQSLAASPTATVTKLRHEWYQDNQNITLTLYVKGVPKDKTDGIEINNDSVYVSLPNPSNPDSTIQFSLAPLFALIDSSQSRATIMSTKIEITLRKASPGLKWHTLEGTEVLKTSLDKNGLPRSSSTAEAVQAARAFASLSPAASVIKQEKAPSYPTSSRNGPKNWDKLADDLHAKTKAKKSKIKTESNSGDDNDKQGTNSAAGSDGEDIDSDFDNGDAVDGFFKKLYAGADDDTRRAMMKSFSESNGTSLSTNWSEVGKGRVEEVKSKDD
ncbi:hypothetical protein LTR84_010782 [Exophiala bonariae]|uniref:Uncharacterized protein n=1 Tax=Exophiala bonariae TaxID=1690606 RepID=A0AAV9NL07_9EURO|nr:hypothetical protein LTR84_010782 [Exophiala bonariae]